jgi:uncharacterized Zn-finger protein
MSPLDTARPDDAVPVSSADLRGEHAVFCPNPKMPLWSSHPRVFIDVGTTGEGRCPYCGTRYRLAPSSAVRGAH